MATEFKIGKTNIGGNNPCFIVAEIGINFDGKYEQALKIIDVAAEAKCSAVKFQLFSAARMYPAKAGKYKTALGDKKNIIDIVKAGELPVAWISGLRKYAHGKGLEFFSSVCDQESTDVLAKYADDALKIPSYEITHLPLITHVAKKGKPFIFSCGGATMREVGEAMEAINRTGNKKIVLNHCIGQYPVDLKNANLAIITTLKLAFPDVIIGYSDHSVDPIQAPRAAVILGAKLIEKHITLDKNLPGPDHAFALEPHELKTMVHAIRKAEKEMASGKKLTVDSTLLGSSERKTFPGEVYVKHFAFRSIFTKKDIKKGELFSRNNMIVLRPGRLKRGLEPKHYELLVQGYAATKNIKAGNSIQWQDILWKKR